MGDRDKEWDVNFDLFLDDGCITALIYTDDNTEEDAKWSNSKAWCLILRQTPDGTPGAYERIGIVDTYPNAKAVVAQDMRVAGVNGRVDGPQDVQEYELGIPLERISNKFRPRPGKDGT